MKPILIKGARTILWFLLTGLTILVISALWVLFFRGNIENSLLNNLVIFSAVITALLSEGLRRYKMENTVNFLLFPITLTTFLLGFFLYRYISILSLIYIPLLVFGYLTSYGLILTYSYNKPYQPFMHFDEHQDIDPNIDYEIRRAAAQFG